MIDREEPYGIKASFRRSFKDMDILHQIIDGAGEAKYACIG